MHRVLVAEFIKLRRAPLLWISVLGISVAPALNGLIMLRQSATWFTFLSQNATFIAVFLGTLLFGLITAYVFGREFAENTAKTLLTLPIKRDWIVLAKLVVLLVWSVFLAAAAFLVSLPIGFAVGLEGLAAAVLWKGLAAYVVTALLLYLTLPVTSFVALAGRGYIPPLAFSVVATTVGFVAFMTDYAGWFPWSIPGLYAVLLRYGESPDPASFVLMGAVFLAGVLLNLLYLRRAEIAK